MILPVRVNFIAPIRDALTELGVSHYRVCAACNSALGNLKAKNDGKVTVKTKDVKFVPGKKEDKIRVSVALGAMSFETKEVNTPLLFVAWHDAIANAQKIASSKVIIPDSFKTWVMRDSFKPQAEDDENATQPGNEETKMTQADS